MINKEFTELEWKLEVAFFNPTDDYLESSKMYFNLPKSKIFVKLNEEKDKILDCDILSFEDSKINIQTS